MTPGQGKETTMNKATIIMASMMAAGTPHAPAQEAGFIGKHVEALGSDLMTPEALWSMGRIGAAQASPDGRRVVYQVGYYSKEQNKGHQVLYVMDADGGNQALLTTSAGNETDPAWIDGGRRIAYMAGGQVWAMEPDGTGRVRLTAEGEEYDGFLFSPDGRRAILVKQLPFHGSIMENPPDLPMATGRLVRDMNYRHWDEYVETIPHPFLADVTDDGIVPVRDILEGEPYECPSKPFGGIEELAWSPDSRYVAYTCRKKTGIDYAVSTDTDIYLYDTETGTSVNLCKPAGYREPRIDNSKSMRYQDVNSPGNLANNPGYDMAPQFSPDGRYLAWLSMARNGCESDRVRLCVHDLESGAKSYVTESFDSNVDRFCWGVDPGTLYFIGVWHGCVNLYRTGLDSRVERLTDGWYDYGDVQPLGATGKLLAERHSFREAPELFVVTPAVGEGASVVEQVTFENRHIYDQLAFGEVRERWTKATDGKDLQYWIILPPHFDEGARYPTLLFCEGGPQSPVSQFWSYRWNMQIMAANGYGGIAPNRRGLPGFGSEWCEQVSGDWTGQCMDDYLSAIDDAVGNLPYVDGDRLGAVGASFGGFSVYYLAGHHEGRFKCFIAHDGAFNLESMYTDTEEVWFSNWEYEDAFWNKDLSENARRTYENSPHRFVDRWDTPILCIHGERDYRINANQGMGAFNAARIRGIPAELLIFPDENHWVLKPQNGILWQRTYFNWLDRWLK